MQLYTSLVRLKQAMNGGELPPMTPIPLSSQRLIDPALTIGMGAITEDLDGGLRCPVRGCGSWHHNLTKHLNASHGGAGGAKGVKRALGIPEKTSLVSHRLRQAASVHAKSLGHLRHKLSTTAERQRQRGRRGGAASALSRVSVNARNLRDRCEQQLAQRLIELQQELGRAPSGPEFISKYGHGLYNAVVDTWGTWNNAKGQCGLDVWKRQRPGQFRHTHETVLAAFGAWHERHHSLPTMQAAVNPTRTPLLPSVEVVFRVMGCRSWPEAMRRVAAFLNIYGGRYGLPEKKAS